MAKRFGLFSLKGLIAGIGALSVAGCLQVMPLVAPKAKNVEEGISPDFPYTYETVTVRGSDMAYIDVGDPDGAPILLVHGNPTSAYLWRNVIPHLTASGRVIAVDLIGMGRSAKPDIDYRLGDHAAYFADFVAALDLKDVTLVLHDWGGGVGFDYAAKNPANVHAIAFFEAVVKPMSLADADFAARYLFGRLRDPNEGHKIAAVDNYFVEKLLPMMSGRTLTDEEMAAYKAPFPTVEARKPVAQWPREIPLDGTPKDNTARVAANFDWLKGADVPLLMLYAEPGMIWTEKTRGPLLEDLPRAKAVSIGSGLHYLQEVQPTRIGQEIATWLESLPASEPAG
ncbi:MAG: haloalkane dehalogenase [Pseudomonadota bacterium]